MNKHFILILINIFFVATSVFSQKLVYEKGPLLLKANSLEDGLGQFVTADLPSVNPKNTIALKPEATPLTKKMWAIDFFTFEGK